MGVLINGSWDSEWDQADPQTRPQIPGASQFRDFVSRDDTTPYRAEPNRYHLYVAIACPWAHRTLVFRKLKQLEKIISVSVVRPGAKRSRLGFHRCGRGFSRSVERQKKPA